MRQQRPQRVGIGPVAKPLRQPKLSRMAERVRSAEISLGAHVEQPPRKAVEVRRHAVLLAHDEPLWAHWHQRSELPDLAIGIDPMDWNVG